MKHIDKLLLTIFVLASIFAAFIVSPYMFLGLICLLVLAAFRKEPSHR